MSIDPNYLAALLQMSYSLCSLKRYEDALITLDKIIEIKPDWYAFMQRAAIKKSLGDIEGAKLDEDAAWESGHDFSAF